MLVRSFFILLTALLLSSILTAQPLRRIGGIGILFKPVNDSIAKAKGLVAAKGLLVTSVQPGETGEALKVKADDILLSVNGKEVPPGKKIYSDVSFTRYEGDETTWLIWRNKKEISLKGKILPKPYETSKEFDIVYDQFPFQNGQIRCIISKPKSTKKKPAILMIQGYPCSSIDLMPAWHPSKQLCDEFTRRGYLVMRAEKPGVGDCRDTPDCYDIDFPTEVASFKAAFQKMKSLPDVDTANLFIFGHSMGGMEAPFIAPDVRPKGVIVFGVVTKNWYEYLMDMLRFQNPGLGIDHVQVEKEMRIYYTLLYDLFVNNKKPSELVAQHPEYLPLLKRDFDYVKGDDFITRNIIFSQSLNNVNMVEAWNKVPCHVLSVHGEYDIQVVDAFGHREIADIVNRQHPGMATFVELPKTDHLFIELEKQEDKWNVYLVPGLMAKLCAENKVNMKGVEQIDSWIKGVMKK